MNSESNSKILNAKDPNLSMNPPNNNEFRSESSWSQSVITYKHEKAKKDRDTNGCLDKGFTVSFLVNFLIND